MNIDLSDSERQIITVLLQKIEIAKVAAEAAVNAYGQAVGIVVQNIVRARGGDQKAQYTLDPSGAKLVQVEQPQGG